MYVSREGTTQANSHQEHNNKKVKSHGQRVARSCLSARPHRANLLDALASSAH